VERRCQDHDHFGVGAVQTVIFDNARFDAGVEEEAQEAQSDVGNDSDMDGAVIGDVGTVDGVNVGAAPELVELRVLPDAFQQPFQLLVVPGRNREASAERRFLMAKRRTDDAELLFLRATPGKDVDAAVCRRQNYLPPLARSLALAVLCHRVPMPAVWADAADAPAIT
jgi:hypothetical protein